MSYQGKRRRGFVIGMLIGMMAFAAYPVNFPMTASWAQRRITSGKFPIHTACMMPGDQFNRVTWSAALGAMVESHLKADGIVISSASDPLASGASEGEMGGVITEINQKYLSVLPLIRKKPGGVTKSVYTLGDQVGMLPCSEGADVLVFVQGVGHLVRDVALLVTIADAKTGEIVAFTQVYPTDASLLESESAFGPQLSQMLAEMKIGTAGKRVAMAGRQRL